MSTDLTEEAGVPQTDEISLNDSLNERNEQQTDFVENIDINNDHNDLLEIEISEQEQEEEHSKQHSSDDTEDDNDSNTPLQKNQQKLDFMSRASISISEDNPQTSKQDILSQTNSVKFRALSVYKLQQLTRIFISIHIRWVLICN